jgi:hypothetical protein
MRTGAKVTNALMHRKRENKINIGNNLTMSK